MAKNRFWFRIAWVGAGLIALAACQMNPAEPTSQAVQVVGVVGGTPAEPTLMGKPLDLQGATLTKEGEAFGGTLLPGMVVQAQGTEQGSTLRLQSLDV